MSEILSYSLADILRTVYAFVMTKIFFPRARLIRRPFHIRGKKHLSYGTGFTTGYACRFELFGESPHMQFGENCHIGDNVHVVSSERVVIGDNFLCASKVFISDTNHGDYSEDVNIASLPTSDPNTRPLFSKPVIIGDNVWLGENVVVLSGVQIGDGCVIGANSVVSKSIPSYTVAAGVPAKPLKCFDSESQEWRSAV